MKQYFISTLVLTLVFFYGLQGQSISPNPESGLLNEVLTVNISGVGTQFQSGTSTCGTLNGNSVVFKQGSETIYVFGVSVISDELITAEVFPYFNTPGDYDITIWENSLPGCQVSCEDCFEVIDPSNASISELDVNSAVQGEELKVTISGEDTYWSQGSPCSINAGNVVFSQGTSTSFTPNNVVVVSADTVCAFITVPQNADIGFFDVTVGANLGCELICEDCFEVLPGSCNADGIQNGSENGVDCGGPFCPPCIGCQTGGNIFVDINATGANDGTSWADAFTDLQSALAIGAYQAIHIAEGLYLPTSTGARGISFEMPNNATILGGYPTGGGARDYNSYQTILSGDLDGIIGLAGNSYHVVKAQNVSCVTIDGVTIKHGSATNSNSFGRSRGAGIYAIGSDITLSNSKITWNRAIKGGGIFASLCPNFTIISSEFSNNTADNGSALYHSNQSNMYIIQSKITNNNSLDRAAIEVNNSLYTRIENSVIANNASANSNAIALIATNRDQTIDVYNTTILGEANNKNLITLQIGFGDQLDANFYNSIIAHQSFSFNKALRAYNNGTLNLYTEHCYIQGSSTIGTTVNNLYSATAGNLMLNSDYSVNPCSPVVDAGNDAIAAGPVDIDENNRFVGTVDIGAYEAQGSCSPIAARASEDLSIVKVFPNPTRSELNIQTLEENITISIFDMLGKRMIHTTLREINISSFPTGLYILNIEKDGEVIHVEKVVKK